MITAETVRVPLVGRFNVQNALAAAATALVAGFRSRRCSPGCGPELVVPGRIERVGAGQPFAVLVDYAHTPDALEPGWSRRRGGSRPAARWWWCSGAAAIATRSKRPLMGEVGARLADLAILTSDNPRSEDPAAIARDVLRSAAPTGPRATGRARPPGRHPRRARVPRGGRRRRDRGQGPRDGTDVAGVATPFDDRVVAAEELERARDRT